MMSHPLRCETCEHCNKKRIHIKYDKFDTYEFYCNKFTLWIFGTAYNTIEIIGCASHSDTRQRWGVYKQLTERFFELLDNIDTISDIAKGDDKLYRSLVAQEHKKRFRYAKPDGSLMDIVDLCNKKSLVSGDS